MARPQTSNSASMTETSAVRSFEQAVAHARRNTARLENRIATITVVLPALTTLCAVLAWATGIASPSPLEFVITIVMYAATLLGITVGFHRLYAHRAFAARPPVRITLGIIGSMAAQGSLIFWVSEHRSHHQHGDGGADPHSPHMRCHQPLSRMTGFWHAHIGWMLRHEARAWANHVPDLLRERRAGFISRWYFAWVIGGLLLPGIVSALFYHSLFHFLLGVVWGGFVRIFLVHHATWSVNSICHLLGTRAFGTSDHSRNNALVALFTFGEGWHNNHHAVPYSARHGLEWWQLDLSYALIRLLAFAKLANSVKVPNADRLAKEKEIQFKRLREKDGA